MVIVAGPSGGGKSSIFSIHNIEGVTPFSNDDYCAALNAQRLGQSQPVYQGITPELRAQGGAVMHQFIEDHIAARRPFAFETTLRELTLEQARRATANGFRVEMVFVDAGPVEEHIRRVQIRADQGGHSASETSLREIYARGMRLLPVAFEANRKRVIETLDVFHNPDASATANALPHPILIVKMVRGYLDLSRSISQNPPDWFRAAVRGSDFEIEKLRARSRDEFER